MNKLKVGIIGCGRIGSRHAEHINNIAELVSVCDVVPEKADELAKKYQSTAYHDAEEMIRNGSNLDLIAICSPNGLHYKHTVTSLNAGFNVLCEKPMALSVQDCGEMIKTAEKNNKRLFVIKQNRFNPPIAAVKNAIDEGRLGKINSVQLSCFWNRRPDYYEGSWKGTKDMDGGTLFTQFSHFVDLLYWMIGDISEVAGFAQNYQHQDIIDFEDAGVVALKFYNGAIGTINYNVNCFSKNMEGSLTLFGDKGTVKIGGQYLNELEYQDIENFKFENLPIGNTANNYGNYQGSMSNHDKVYENVVDVLQKGGTISTNMFEGLKTVEIIDKIYKAF